MDITWDRNDIVTLDTEDDQYNNMKLVKHAMRAVRSLRKTNIGVQRGCEELIALAEWGESVARDTGASMEGDHGREGNVGNRAREERQACTVEDGEGTETELDPHSPPTTNIPLISECAPKEALTKGRKRRGKQLDRDETCTKQSVGVRTCGYCGLTGHYTTGCELNPDNAWKKRGGSGSLRGKMGRKRGRPPTKRQLEDEFDYVA